MRAWRRSLPSTATAFATTTIFPNCCAMRQLHARIAVVGKPLGVPSGPKVVRDQLRRSATRPRATRNDAYRCERRRASRRRLRPARAAVRPPRQHGGFGRRAHGSFESGRLTRGDHVGRSPTACASKRFRASSTRAMTRRDTSSADGRIYSSSCCRTACAGTSSSMRARVAADMWRSTQDTHSASPSPSDALGSTRCDALELA